VRLKDFAALIALAAIWGSSYLFIRVAVDSLGPLVLSFLRVVIGAVGLLTYATLRGKNAESQPLNRIFLILAVLNTAVPYALISFSEIHLTASMAGILNATVPLFTALAAAGWNRQRVPAKTIAGIVLGMTGVTVLVGWNPAPFDSWLVISVFAMLGASASYGLANVYAKRSLKGISTLGAATGQQLGGAVWLFPFAIGAVSTGASDLTPSRNVVLSMLALGIVCTSAAYLLYFYLIANAGPVHTSSVGFLIPIFGILWSALFLDEAVRPSMLIGLGIILASVGLVTGIRFRELLPFSTSGRRRTDTPEPAPSPESQPASKHPLS
jgi:drug/metabolite transporter (DMT)-like permease